MENRYPPLLAAKEAIIAGDINKFNTVTARAALDKTDVLRLAREIVAHKQLAFIIPVVMLCAKTPGVYNLNGKLRDLYHLLLTHQSTQACTVLSEFLEPRTIINGASASLEDVLFKFCDCWPIEKIAVEIGFEAVARLITGCDYADLSGLPGRPYGVRLKELLKTVINCRRDAWPLRDTEKNRIITLLLEAKPTMFGKDRKAYLKGFLGDNRPNTSLLEVVLETLRQGHDMEVIDGEPLWLIVQRRAYAENPKAWCDFFEKNAKSDSLIGNHNLEDRSYHTSLLFGAWHTWHPQDGPGPLTRQMLSRRWVSPRNSRPSPDSHLGIYQQSLEHIFVVLLCARRIGFRLPPELWFLVFGMLSYEDFISPFP